jgi:hypothetical protein
MIHAMDGHALERLGHHIVSRRVALGYRNRTDFANSLQFTVRTLSDVENGVRKASPGTYAMLENKLGCRRSFESDQSCSLKVTTPRRLAV